MASTILRNGRCAVMVPPSIEEVDLRIENGLIRERGVGLEVRPDDTVIDMTGKTIIPGLVCSHTHLYSSLSRGMPAPQKTPTNFPEILQHVWWRLDRALNADGITHSGLAGALEAVRCGVTTLVDHHASPYAITGSLALLKNAMERVGIRGVLCYETSDRDGMERRDEGLEENRSFIESTKDNPMFRGLVGAHASFTLSDDSLKKLGDLAQKLNTGVHIHVAEDIADVNTTRERFNAGIMERFAEYGILRRESLFAHCLHLRPEEFERIRAAGTWSVHNPRSNMNNNVGHAPLHQYGLRAALGTDGFTPDMFEELRSAYFKNQESSRAVPPMQVIDLLQNGQELISEIFGARFGTLSVGSAADLAVLDYPAPTPLSAGNLPFHFLFGLRSAMVESVMVAGKWILRDREFTTLNERELLASASKAAADLWRTMDGL